MPGDTHPSTHPPLPPTTEDDRVSWLRLLRSYRVGNSTFYRLMAEHGSAQAALAALPGVARAAGVENYTPCPEASARAELDKGRAAGAQLLCVGETGFPPQLLDIPDPPPLLWARGDLSLLRRPAVALVGARNASSLGTRMARALAADLGARGLAVVSGLARGVDAAAHAATLDTGPLAVMAGGIDVIYPAENTRLAESIFASGLALSEQPVGMAPRARHFPARNRLISGLSRAVVVVEAAAKSGSLITARTALDQGREVFAVPGHPFDARAAGCNMLIRDGATLVRNAEDVAAALPPVAEPSETAPELALPEPAQAPAAAPAVTSAPASPKGNRGLRETAALHTEILDRLGPSPLAEDQLIRDLGRPAQSVSPVLVDLELDGRIERRPGGLLSRTG
ncbi:DNA-processing protein DprA [Roseovarius salinarum]|uniref:DNA-processing protein DprA n=1 Tax=Roseovarius salinarum TaxID=1981892 RepID=UPI000C337B33|nr:DNA-processing protein DprA [Roseovarius salinarum]